MRRSPSGTIALRTESEAVVLTYRVRASLGSYRRIDDRHMQSASHRNIQIRRDKGRWRQIDEGWPHHARLTSGMSNLVTRTILDAPGQLPAAFHKPGALRCQHSPLDTTLKRPAPER